MRIEIDLTHYYQTVKHPLVTASTGKPIFRFTWPFQLPNRNILERLNKGWRGYSISFYIYDSNRINND